MVSKHHLSYIYIYIHTIQNANHGTMDDILKSIWLIKIHIFCFFAQYQQKIYVRNVADSGSRRGCICTRLSTRILFQFWTSKHWQCIDILPGNGFAHPFWVTDVNNRFTYSNILSIILYFIFISKFWLLSGAHVRFLCRLNLYNDVCREGDEKPLVKSCCIVIHRIFCVRC